MKFKNILLILFAIAIISSCNKKDDFNYPEGTVGSSKIVYFPSVAIKGDRLIILKQGQAFTDPGVTSLLNGQAITATTTGSVNTATPGIYLLNYTAKNPEGFSASDWRTVVVIGSDVESHDYSGNYARYVGAAPNGQTSTWTKTAPGVYNVVNPGGATGVTAIAVNYSGTNIAIPLQLTEVGQFSSTNGKYYPSATPPYYEWIIINATYGNTLRTFVKQ